MPTDFEALPPDPFLNDEVHIPPVQLCDDPGCKYNDAHLRHKAFYGVVMQSGATLAAALQVLRRHGEEIAPVAMLQDLTTFLKTVDTYLEGVNFYGPHPTDGDNNTLA